jgi:cytochrome c peroxidase
MSKSLPLISSTILASAALVLAPVFAPAIDLENPHPYSSQPVPAYIVRDNTPPQNAITDHGAMLGRVLFYDKRLSVDHTISCASCHQQAHGFSDPAVASTGVAGTTGRHSMRLVNIRFGVEQRMFWDERATSVENQATQPIRDHIEMGFSGTEGDPGFDVLINRLAATDYYPPLFATAFGDSVITEERIQRAIAQFVRSIQSFDSRFDLGFAANGGLQGNFANFTASENRGKNLFVQAPVFGPDGLRTGGGAGCAGCHRPPEFDIDPASRNNGVLGAIGGGEDLTNTRSPSLRNLTDPQGNPHGPFMHDGSLASLEAVIAHYNAIPQRAAAPAVRQTVDPRLLPGGNPQRLQLTAQQTADIVAFLKTLSGPAVHTGEQWSDPFDSEGNLVLEGLVAKALSGWLVW